MPQRKGAKRSDATRPTEKTLGEKLKEARKAQGLSQEELSQRSKVHPKHISRYENDKALPMADTLKRLAEVLQVSVDHLLFDNVPRSGRPDIKDLQLLEMFSTVEQMQPKDKEAVKTLLQALIIKNQVEDVLKA